MNLSRITSSWFGFLIGAGIAAWLNKWQMSSYLLAVLLMTQLLVVIVLVRIITSKAGREIFDEDHGGIELKGGDAKSDININDLIENIKDALMDSKVNEKQYTLNNIYDESGVIGHEWNVFVEKGYWVKMIFDEKSKNFTVKHLRSKTNIASFKDRDEIIKAEIKYNRDVVYGYRDKIRTQERIGEIFIAKE